MASSLIVMMLKSLLDTSISEHHPPKKILQILQENLYGQIPRGYYVAFSYLLYEHKTNKLNFATAGLYGLILLRKGENRLEIVEAKNFAIAFIGSDRFNQKSVTLGSGDRIILYTDGLIEAVNANGEMYGHERLFNFINQYQHLPSQELLNAIAEDSFRHAANLTEQDDTTIMLIEVK